VAKMGKKEGWRKNAGKSIRKWTKSICRWAWMYGFFSCLWYANRRKRSHEVDTAEIYGTSEAPHQNEK